MNMAIVSDHSPSDCCWFYIALAFEPRLAPAPPLVQEAVGGDGDAVERFFEPELWAKDWGLPLWLAFATGPEWQVVAGWWREALARREGRFLSLEEIEKGWDGGNDG
ncbi:MAG TPA: hypothetical protein VK540_35620 [Polyangiaceae bacterium]|nr:hypothetical protein [Polyangiaceae bacterium]